jgi:hypothetical protein
MTAPWPSEATSASRPVLRHGAWGGCRRGAAHETGALDAGGSDRRWWSAISPFTLVGEVSRDKHRGNFQPK